MNINKNLLIVALFLFATTITYGQRRPDREKIKSLKVAYITERLSLTSDEAQAFWPIYNAHEKKKDSFRGKERSQIYSKIKDMESLSNTEVENLLQDLIALEKEKQAVREQFLKDVQKVISAKKTFLLLRTENGFKRRLLQQYRQKHGDGPR
jgi:hypothetical protein